MKKTQKKPSSDVDRRSELAATESMRAQILYDVWRAEVGGDQRTQHHAKHLDTRESLHRGFAS